jgi:hypothetical protein
MKTALRLGLCVVCAAVMQAASAAAQPKMIVLKGYQARTPMDNEPDEFKCQERLKAAFAGYDVQFFLMNVHGRKQVVSAIVNSDILYVNTHAMSPFPVGGVPMQALQVAPSVDNPDKSPAGNSLATARYIRDELKVRLKGPGPRLVILNGCEVTNKADGVAEANRISGAIGIFDEPRTVGRAYVGWDYPIAGGPQDPNFISMLERWTKPGPDGKYPTLKQAIEATSWGAIKPPVIVGDAGLRYK